MQSMKKLFSCLALLAALSSGTAALAQVAESPAWATRIKAEGLGNSQIDELSQYMTDYVGSRLTASRQKRRADSLMLAKLTELGLSNPRSAFATEFTRGGWDVVKTYCAMTAPYYCAFSVNPRAWSGSTDGLVKGECVIFDVQSKEDLEQYRGKVAGKILLIPSTQTIDIRFEPLASRYTDEQLEALTQDNRANQRPRGGRMNYDYRAMMELRQQMADFYKTGLGRTVGFKNGGYLVIDRTEALFAIDVNTGSKKLFEDHEENAFQYNMLAADEIVHQLRLRDIGGIIIIDFVDMDSKDHQEQLYRRMCQLMANDRAKHNVLPLSKFGLMQITRQRVRPAVEVNVTEVCPMCLGKGKVQPTLLFTDQVEEQIAHMREHFGRGIRVHLHPYVFAYVTRGSIFSRLSAKWFKKYNVRVQENQSLGMLETKFYSRNGELLQLPKEDSEKS